MLSSDGDSTDDMPLMQRINANGKKRKLPGAAKKSNGKLRKKVPLLNDDDSPASESENEFEDDDVPLLERTGEKNGRKREALKVSSTPINPVGRYTSVDVEPLLSSASGGKWWTLPPLPEGQKWQSLRHNGVLFPPPYKPHGVKMLYCGQPVDLTPEHEEIMTFYAVMLETDYLKNPKFRENFFNDWKKVLGEDHIIQDLDKCDFTPVYEWHLELKAQKTNAHLTKEQRQEHNKKPEVIAAKQKAAEEKKRIEELYGFALVDGCREKVGNFRVEPPGLFRGRGDHPKTGKVKARINPEDIVINIGNGECIPKCPLEGHNWKGIVHNDKVTWLAYWTENINGSIKYVYLHSSSRFKGQSDMDKFEKARELHRHIKSIRDKYMWGMKQTDELVKQRATAMWIIDVLALRVGNEKSTDDEADTVGCCSLRVEHLQFREPNFVQFDFLGKDSMRYFNEVPVIGLVYKNLRHFCSNKQATDQVFDRLSTSELNKYLNECMPGLSAKVFRTYNASITLEKELIKPTIGPGDEPIEVPQTTDAVPVKVFYYNRANREVAILCNHQRTIPKQFENQMEKIAAKISESEAKRDLLKDYLDACINHKADSFENPPMKSQDPEKVDASLRTADTRLAKLKLDRKLKDENKSVALGTSKINYMDPRITVAWCKRLQVPIEKIFNKSLLEKFPWAMEVPSSWSFTNVQN